MSTYSASIQEVLQPKNFDLLKKNFQSIQNSHHKTRSRNMSQSYGHSPAKIQYSGHSFHQTKLPVEVEPNIPPKTPPRGGLGWQMREVQKSTNGKPRDFSNNKDLKETSYQQGFVDYSTSQKANNNASPYYQTAQGFYNQRTVKNDRYRVESVDRYESNSQRIPTQENANNQNYQSVDIAMKENEKNNYRKRAQSAHSKNQRLINNPSVDLKLNKYDSKNQGPYNNENQYHLRGQSTQIYNNSKDDALSIKSGMSKYTSQSRLNTNESGLEQNNQCFDIDYSFLDKVSINDPQIQQVLNDDLLSNQSLALDQMLDENPDYFHHMFGNCACFKCTCAECQCNFAYIKLTYKPGFVTHNSVQYKYKQPGTGVTPALNQTNYESLADLKRGQAVIDPMHTTTNQSFYTTHDPQPRFKRPQFYRAQHPFMGSTSYGNQFKDWKDYDPTWVFQRPENVDVVGAEFPIAANTSYGNFFNQSQEPIGNANADDVKKMQKNCVIDDLYKDDKPTMYKTKYQQFNVQDVPNTYLPFKWFSQTQKPNIIPTFENQFKSTFTNDFHAQFKNSCPSQKMGMTQPWKAKLLNQLRAFKDAHIAAQLEGKGQ